ncbi:MAG: hypothetical protein JWM02_3318 [Frankiales bacterium]|nr:hypothetical protein [Frankiales bacterium]
MVTTDDVLAFLGDVDFPASRDEIVLAAQEAEAPPAVRKALRAMPPVDYQNKAEVARSARTGVSDLTEAQWSARRRDRKHERIALAERDPDV